jgi:PPOX class probable F420-dependent enzyme
MFASPDPLPARVLDRLVRERNAWMCTLRPDGSPHVTPVWFVYQHGSWWIGTDARSVKVRNVTADPRVSVVLEDGDAPVVAEGRAILHHHDFRPDVVAGFAAKYHGWDVTRPYSPRSARVLFEVPVERWLLAGTAR